MNEIVNRAQAGMNEGRIGMEVSVSGRDWAAN
jgi:hypothetical protein